MFAAYELMQLVCPDMIEAGGGSVINITSVASRLPGNGPYPDRAGGVLPGYGGSKAALEHLTQCAAFDLAGHNVAVNALSPSKPIMTPGLSYYATNFSTPPPRTNSPGRQCSWRWWTPPWSPGARSVIVRYSTAASGRSPWPSNSRVRRASMKQACAATAQVTGRVVC